jgi:lipid A 3-O-deacylase
MTRILLLLGIIAALSTAGGPARAQTGHPTKKDSVTHLYRFFEDDDYINFWGHGTDNAYTNGSRIDYFYQPAQRPHGVLGKYAPRAGDSSIDIYSWGIMEMMYTPDNLTKTEWQPNDYQYAGALIVIHSLYSYNPAKKYDVQTQVVFGVIGPAALGREIQTSFHRLIRYTVPMGWGHQFRNDALLNVNITAEKQVAAVGNALEVIAGGQVYGGTMENGAAIYPMILIGRKNPYFNGLFSQYTSPGHLPGARKNWQLYFLFKPELQFVAQNALLQGGMFTHNPNLEQAAANAKSLAASGAFHVGDAAPLQLRDINHWVPTFTYGWVFSRGDFGISMTQDISAAMVKGLYCHTVGNISLYFSW